MSMCDIYKCAQCKKPASSRCSRCKSLYLCFRECLVRAWPAHKPECQVIVQGREALLASGIEEPSPGVKGSAFLPIPSRDYISLLAPISELRISYEPLEQRLYANDPTLSTADKVRYYCDLMKACDSTSVEHEGKPLLHKMLLNRRYNDFHRDATARLERHELQRLEREQVRLGIGVYFKSGRRTL